jgi:hypothetical protein
MCVRVCAKCAAVARAAGRPMVTATMWSKGLKAKTHGREFTPADKAELRAELLAAHARRSMAGGEPDAKRKKVPGSEETERALYLRLHNELTRLLDQNMVSADRLCSNFTDVNLRVLMRVNGCHISKNGIELCKVGKAEVLVSRLAAGTLRQPHTLTDATEPLDRCGRGRRPGVSYLISDQSIDAQVSAVVESLIQAVVEQQPKTAIQCLLDQVPAGLSMRKQDGPFRRPIKDLSPREQSVFDKATERLERGESLLANPYRPSELEQAMEISRPEVFHQLFASDFMISIIRTADDGASGNRTTCAGSTTSRVDTTLLLRSRWHHTNLQSAKVAAPRAATDQPRLLSLDAPGRNAVLALKPAALNRPKF